MEKYVFVTGGVLSGIGKGLAAASLGSLLESHGLTVAMVKIDPYINVDAGTMSPFQHGEVYVTDDGAETDLDLGNYARFTSSRLGRANSITTGQVYQEVIQREREGRYLGRTVQVIPHITDRIKQRIRALGSDGVDVTIIEVGGTVGDIEGVPFLEAARQMRQDLGSANVLYVHLTLVPEVAGHELKTKPTQHSVRELREIGLQPDVLICRAPFPVPGDLRRKIALFTSVDVDAVISAHDVADTIYEIPLLYREQRLDEIVIQRLGLSAGEASLDDWEQVVRRFRGAERTVRVAMVGKYIELADAYKSVDEALMHAGIANDVRVELIKLDSERMEKDGLAPEERFRGVNGILVPGGFGSRGIPGMIGAANFAREQGIPYLGLCLGLQVMVIEFARAVAALADADSTEFSPATPHPVVSLLEEQINVQNYGGTMRLGRSETVLVPGTLTAAAYGKDSIHERHRHRYEVSNEYRSALQEAGLVVAGHTPDGALVEAVEWPNHPFGVGVQFHPEFQSRPVQPHPLFRAFIAAAAQHAGT